MIEVEKECKYIAEQKLVTERKLMQVTAFIIDQMKELNKQQDEKFAKLNVSILGHHEYVKEQNSIFFNNMWQRLLNQIGNIKNRLSRKKFWGK